MFICLFGMKSICIVSQWMKLFVNVLFLSFSCLNTEELMPRMHPSATYLFLYRPFITKSLTLCQFRCYREYSHLWAGAKQVFWISLLILLEVMKQFFFSSRYEMLWNYEYGNYHMKRDGFFYFSRATKMRVSVGEFFFCMLSFFIWNTGKICYRLNPIWYFGKCK